VYAGSGNAETSRKRNLQFFEMTPQQHPPGNASATRYRNLEFFEMTNQVHPPGNASVSRCRNLQFLEMTTQSHPAGNASVSRYRNLEFFEMTPQQHPPGNASATRYKNLQFFEMNASEQPSVTISPFTTTDENGNPKSTFNPGNMVVFKIVMAPEGSQNIPNALVYVMVQDRNSTVMFLSYISQDINVGKQTTVYLGFQVPYNCLLGDYTTKVSILTKLLSQGGQPILGGHGEVHFTVS
jgi:hypothetical protein